MEVALNGGAHGAAADAVDPLARSTGESSSIQYPLFVQRPQRVPDLLAVRAQSTPDRTAHDDTSRTLTFAEWDAECSAVAGGLTASGVVVGDRVLLPITNHHGVDMAVLFLAVQRAGAIAVPLNTRLTKDEMRYFADLTGARWVVTDVPEKLPTLDVEASWTVDQVPRDPSSLLDQTALDPDADADIISTSGTTGRPKGVVFTHRDLMDRFGDGTASSPSKILMHALPFSGFGGCHGLMLSTLHYGSTLVTQPVFDPAGMVELIEAKHPDTLHLVPSMLRLILDLPNVEQADLSSVRWVITGTAPLPADTVSRMNDLWPHIRVVNVYGMTESAVSVATKTRTSVLKPGSVGTPDDPTSVEIRDVSGAVVPVGVDGEVWTRAGRPRRYWGDDRTTQATWTGGWLNTGDIGHFDQDGDLILTGRSKELIIRGGYNIAPGEVENVLLAHPAVADAAVVGVPHPVLGEDVAAAVVLHAGADVSGDDLRANLREQLADNKVPRTIVFKESLPYNQNLKILKRELVPELTSAAEKDREQRAATR